MVSGPFPEPLFASRRDSFAHSRIQVTATRSFFDQIVEEFFASFDDDLVLATSSAVMAGEILPFQNARRPQNIIGINLLKMQSLSVDSYFHASDVMQ